MKWSFLGLLVSTYVGIKGALNTLLGFGVFALFRVHYELSGTEYQKYTIPILLPWALKPLMGIMSDSFPLCGHYKRWYIVIASIFGTLASFCVAMFALKMSALQLSALAFLISTQVAFLDLLTESEYAGAIAKNTKETGNIMSTVWTCFFVGQVSMSALAGPLVDAEKTPILFWIALPFATQSLIPPVCGWFDDKTVHYTPTSKPKRIVVLAVVIAISASILSIISVFCSSAVKLVFSIVFVIILIVLTLHTLPTIKALPNIYMFLSSVLNVQIPGALDYFYVAGPDCVSNGPAFNMTYYMSVLSIVSAIAGIVAVSVFRWANMSTISFRTLFWTTSVCRSIAALVDIAVVNRWNLTSGISDTAMLIGGKAVAQAVTAVFESMPAVLLTAKLCPDHNDSTMYAIMAGFQNFGMGVATVIGVTMLDFAEVHLTPDPAEVCVYNNLSYVILAANVVLPLCVVPLTWFLVPSGNSETPTLKLNNCLSSTCT